MKKEISYEEKLEFYKKYSDKDFLDFLEKTEDKYSKIGFTSIKIFFVVGIVGLFFTPWMVFSFLPGLIIPLLTMSISHFKIKKRVESFTENITYKDFIEMCNSNEWKKIALEVREQKKSLEQNNHSDIRTSVNNKTMTKNNVTAICEHIEKTDLST